MVDLAALEQRLGIALPDSYNWVIEEFGTPMSEPYIFFTADRVGWYADHARATEHPLPGGAVVLGEDLAGNPLVFLSFPVAGVPALSDEVYLLRIGEKPEEVALDFASLLESLGIALVEQDRDVYETAFRVRDVGDLTAAVEQVLSARGYLPAEHGDEEGDHVFISLFVDDGIVWLRDIDASWLWFGRRLSLRTRRVVHGWEVIVSPDLEQAGEDLIYPATARKVRIDTRGEMRDVDPGYSAAGANDGDPVTTARNILWELIGESEEPPHTVAFYLPPRPTLTPRLTSILTAISEADSVDLTEISGQRAVRIELPDGTRQLSVLSDADLATLREHTNALD